MAKKTFSSTFKAKVALDAIKAEKTAAELSSEHGVHPTQINKWKKQLQDALPGVFETGRERKDQAAQEAKQAQLYQQIGKLQVEVEWLRKKSMDLGLM